MLAGSKLKATFETDDCVSVVCHGCSLKALFLAETLARGVTRENRSQQERVKMGFRGLGDPETSSLAVH